MTSGAIFAELHMVAGERQEASNLAGVATSPVLSLFKRRRGQLFTVIDPSRRGADSICSRLIQAIEDEYFRMPSRSITRSFQAAIDVANDVLVAENAKLPPEKQLRAGLCCAAVRGGDVFVAQVAPASAFILHKGTVTRIFGPAGMVLNPGGNEVAYASDSLGSPVEPHISFGFSPVDAGDLVVLASGSSWKIIPDRYLVEAARQIDPDMAAQALYGSFTAHVRRPTTSMIVIKMADLPARGRDSGADSRVRVAGEPDGVNEDLEVPVGVLQASEFNSELPGRKGRTRAGATARPSSSGSGAGERRPVRRGDSAKPAAAERTAVRRPRTSTGLSFWDKLWLSLGRGQKPRARLPGGTTESRSGASVKLRQPKPMRGERHTRSGWLPQLLVLIALAIVFVVVGNAAIGLWKSWQIGDADALLKQARDKQAMAAVADSPASARAALTQAQELIARAMQVRDDQATRSMETSVKANIDRMDAVVRVDKATTVIDFSAVIQDKGDVTQLVLDGGNVYALDEAQDRLFMYGLTPDGRALQDPGKHPVLMKKGDRIDGKPVNGLFQMAWLPAGQLRTQSGLFLLDSSRSLIFYDPKVGQSRIDVADSGRWGTIQSIAGFAGGVYLLDTKQKNIYYYPPTKNGFESQPYVIVDANSRADLSKAIDIALDGNLYILESTGAIRRFSREGRPLDFVGDVPDGKVVGAKALFASASTRSVYELDAGGERILQFSPEGKFQRQFRAEGKDVSFKDARDLFVDEAARRVYLLTRTSLIVFDLPPMQ